MMGTGKDWAIAAIEAHFVKWGVIYAIAVIFALTIAVIVTENPFRVEP